MIFVKPIFFEYEPIKIANVTESSDVAAEVARFIGLYERQCLDLVLGKCLAKDLVDSFVFNPTAKVFELKATATQPIKNIVNGFDYVKIPNTDFDDCFSYSNACSCNCSDVNCNKRKWNGIIEKTSYFNGNSVATFEQSFLANYIYYQYQLSNRTVTAGTGQQVLDGENSTTNQNFSKRIEAYNLFVVGVMKLYMFLNDNKADYPEWERNCNINFKDKW